MVELAGQLRDIEKLFDGDRVGEARASGFERAGDEVACHHHVGRRPGRCPCGRAAHLGGEEVDEVGEAGLGIEGSVAGLDGEQAQRRRRRVHRPAEVAFVNRSNCAPARVEVGLRQYARDRVA